MTNLEFVGTATGWLIETLSLGQPCLSDCCPFPTFSQVFNPGLPLVKQEPPDPEEDKEEKSKDDSASDSAPEEEAAGAGTPVVSAGGHLTLP